LHCWHIWRKKLREHFTLAHYMDVRFLSTFLEVSRTRHFGRAAENLYLTQSAVSARIKLLEEYFNTGLFVRHRNSIQLTPAGEKLLPYAQSLSSTLSEARNALIGDSVLVLVSAATPNAYVLFLQQALRRFKDNYPQLSVRAEIFSIDQLSRQLHDRVVDLGFSTEALKSDDFENIVLHSTPLALYSSGPTKIEDALDNYLHIEWSSKISEQLYQRYPQTKNAPFKTGALSVAIDYLQIEGGCALLPDHEISGYVRPANLVKLDTFDDMTVVTYLVYMQAIKHSGLAGFIDFFHTQK
jgi:DNA-binding transcriptional LysR family regulator